MSRRREVQIPLTGLQVLDTATGSPADLGALDGVHVVVLMRHRH